MFLWGNWNFWNQRELFMSDILYPKQGADLPFYTSKLDI
jgi:hypothetical protein